MDTKDEKNCQVTNNITISNSNCCGCNSNTDNDCCEELEKERIKQELIKVSVEGGKYHNAAFVVGNRRFGFLYLQKIVIT
jgi:hypothetical protein